MRIAQMTELDIGEIQIASNGYETLEKLKISTVDIMLCDINMPEMNGYELVKNVRELPDSRNIRIIMTSTENTNEIINKVIASGADDHITKPFTPNKLCQKLSPFVHMN